MEETHGAPWLQQLREELLARLWAMQTISPSTLTGTVRRETAQHLDAASDRWWRMLRDADPRLADKPQRSSSGSCGQRSVARPTSGGRHLSAQRCGPCAQNTRRHRPEMSCRTDTSTPPPWPSSSDLAHAGVGRTFYGSVCFRRRRWLR
jgi:hypothetical protein